MAKKNPRFRHKFSFSGNIEKKTNAAGIRDDIIDSLRRSQTGEHVLEVRENATWEPDQPDQPFESGSTSKHRSAKRWIATLTLLGAPVAAWLSGLLPGTVTGATDSGIVYMVSGSTSFGPVMFGEIVIMGLVIATLGRRIRHRPSPHPADAS